MTLNNFEKKLKEQLKEREIRPSKRSWNEISAALDGQKDAARGNYFWYGIAAGFIGLLMVSVLFFTADTSFNSTDIQVVDAPEDVIKEIQIPQGERPDETILIPINKEIPVITAKEVVENQEKAAQSIEKLPETIVVHRATETVRAKAIPVTIENSIDTKLMEVIAQADLMEKDKSKLSDAEVDSLLRQAQKELLTQQNLQHVSSIDATALLNQVEDELDQSFRDQIFEKLKTGFIKVRSAVADRNN